MSQTPKIPNLWGHLPVEEKIRTPYVILKEQASLLTEMTNGLLLGNVDREDPEDGNFVCTLEIVVPSLNNYSISILIISYPINTYPCKVSSYLTDDKNIECPTEDSLFSVIRALLSSPQVKKIISALLNEVHADVEQEA